MRSRCMMLFITFTADFQSRLIYIHFLLQYVEYCLEYEDAYMHPLLNNDFFGDSESIS